MVNIIEGAKSTNFLIALLFNSWSKNQNGFLKLFLAVTITLIFIKAKNYLLKKLILKYGFYGDIKLFKSILDYIGIEILNNIFIFLINKVPLISAQKNKVNKIFQLINSKSFSFLNFTWDLNNTESKITKNIASFIKYKSFLLFYIIKIKHYL